MIQTCYVFSAAVYLHETIFKLVSFSLLTAPDRFGLFATALKNVIKQSKQTVLAIVEV